MNNEESKLTASVHLLDISVHFVPEISQKLFDSPSPCRTEKDSGQA